MPKSTVNCPRCKSPVIADIHQLFDVNTDPSAKQRILGGAINIIRCSMCGYEGPVSLPLVYHDPTKELLLTFFPPELGVPINEQEKRIGPMLKRVMDNLPPEKRKGYLLRPQTMFTLQTMIEKILEADGISKEVIQAQQDRLKLIQRLFEKESPARSEIIKQNESLIDQDFFAILSRIIETTLAQGDKASGQRLAELQQQLLEESKFGLELKTQISETEEAIKSLQEASKDGLTHEKLLELIINAQSDLRLKTLVTYARSGLDYTFFQLLSEKIEKSQGEQKQKLLQLREKLLALTKELDDRMQAQVEHSQAILEKILESPNMEKAIQENLPEINDLFVEILKVEIGRAKQNDHTERLGKLEKIISTLQKMSPPPQELVFIEELIELENDTAVQKKLEENPDKITPDFLQMLNTLVTQSESQGQSAEMPEHLKKIYRYALKQSMKNQMKA
jgi:hypothetical protein